jgi:hypothetical protein
MLPLDHGTAMTAARRTCRRTSLLVSLGVSAIDVLVSSCGYLSDDTVCNTLQGKNVPLHKTNNLIPRRQNHHSSSNRASSVGKFSPVMQQTTHRTIRREANDTAR